MLTIGCHLSMSKGYVHMGREALSIGANTFQFFTRNPRGLGAKAVNVKDMEDFNKMWKENSGGRIIAHSPYTLNACSAKPDIRQLAREIMADDLDRLEHIPGTFYNFHPGSHTGQGMEKGIEYIVDMLNAVIKPEQKTTVLLETMAGKGSEIGGKFEELKEILDKVQHPENMGVCMDTCHIFDGGYDIVNNLDGVLNEFDRTVGLDKLCFIHLNDSKNPVGSHKDRHELLGKGNIGMDALMRFVNHPSIKGLPIVLETPNDLKGYAQEIAAVRELYRG